MELIRSFIAIELPDEIRTGIQKIQQVLQATGPCQAKWVDPRSIHLTLKFLGNVDADKIGSVSEAMQQAAGNISFFNLEIKGLGAFPNFHRVQVVWIGLKGDLDTLQELQNNIESFVAPLGFPTEKRAFIPHLTLARVRETATFSEREALGEVLAKSPADLNHVIKVKSISLIKSQLTRQGAIYTRLCSADLKPSCQ